MVTLFLVELIQKHTNIGRFRPKPPQKYPPKDIFCIDFFYVFFGQVTESKDQNAPGFLPQPSNTVVIVASSFPVSQVLQPYSNTTST